MLAINRIRCVVTHSNAQTCTYMLAIKRIRCVVTHSNAQTRSYMQAIHRRVRIRVHKEQELVTRRSPALLYNLRILSDFKMSSICDSMGIEAAEDVERVDREQNVSQDTTNTSSSSISSMSPRKVDVNYIQAWMEDLPLPDMSDPATKPKTPTKINNLLNKPLKSSRLIADHCMCPCHVSLRMGGTTPQSSSQAESQVLAPTQPTVSSSSLLTPEHSPTGHSTHATKASRKPITHDYSRWSLSSLQEEYLQRFQPLSQKRTLDRQFMIDALTFYEVAEASRSSSCEGEPEKKKT